MLTAFPGQCGNLAAGDIGHESQYPRSSAHSLGLNIYIGKVDCRQLTLGLEMVLLTNTRVGVHGCTGHTGWHQQQPLPSHGW